MRPEKELFTKQILDGITVKELQDYYSLSRSSIYSYKKKWSLSGLTPNSKKLVNEEGLKTCTSCGDQKDLSEFYRNGYQPNGKIKYKGKCRTCQNTYDYSRKKNKIEEILLDLGIEYKCRNCGYNKNTAALCFHHLDPSKKDFELSKLSENLTKDLKEEISKCIVLCHNCHMEEHYPHLKKQTDD